jgi:hypothetical protein
MPSTLTVNAPNVVHETIDGETIVIDLTSGTYFSLDGVGCEISVARLGERYEVDGETAERCVSALVREMLDARLLRASPSGTNGDSPGGGTNGDSPGSGTNGGAIHRPITGSAGAGVQPAGTPPGERLPFEEPVLHTYTDMQEFMLVDPIHDVEAEAGWPHVKEA